MLKAFFRDSAVYGTARLLTGSIALLSLPIYTRALSPGDYGVVDLLTTVAAILHVSVALEIAQGFGRYVMSPEAAGARESYASTALWFTLAAYSLFTVLVVPIAGSVSVQLFGTVEYATIVRVAMLALWSHGAFYLVQNLLRYGRRALPYAAVSVVFSATSVGVTLALLLVVRTGLVGVFIGQFVAGLMAAGLGLWLARDSIRAVFDRARCREMLAFSLPLVPSSLGVMLSLYVDRYAIVRLMSLEDLGLYGVAFRLASIVGVALSGFLPAVAPLIYQQYQDPATPGQVARMFQWFLAVAIPLVLLLGFFSDELVSMAAPPAYFGATRLIFLLSVSIVLSTCYTFAPGLWIAKRTGWVAVIGISSGLLNLVLNFVLIPRVGLIGAALATAVSAGVACVAHFASGQAFYKVPFAWGRIAAASALVTAAALLVAAGALDPLGVASPTGLVVKAVTWVIISIAASAILLGRRDVLLIRDTVRKLVADRDVPAAG